MVSARLRLTLSSRRYVVAAVVNPLPSSPSQHVNAIQNPISPNRFAVKLSGMVVKRALWKRRKGGTVKSACANSDLGIKDGDAKR